MTQRSGGEVLSRLRLALARRTHPWGARNSRMVWSQGFQAPHDPCGFIWEASWMGLPDTSTDWHEIHWPKAVKRKSILDSSHHLTELMVARLLGDSDYVNTIRPLSHLSLPPPPSLLSPSPPHSLLHSHFLQNRRLRVRARIDLSVKSCRSLSEMVSSTPSSRHR